MRGLHQASCVAFDDRAILIEGKPGSGKSSLALALIDRGALLVGDDGVRLKEAGGQLIASPPPNIEGLIEVRNVGLLEFPVSPPVRVALVILLDADAPRHVEDAEFTRRGGVMLPLIRLWPDTPVLALRAETALSVHGLP